MNSLLLKGSGCILCMEDDSIVRLVLEKMLQRLNYNVHCAVDGKLALDLYDDSILSGTPYSAIITDLTVINGMGGVEFLENLKKRGCTLPVIVASGYSEGGVIADYKQYGFAAAIKKPFAISDLSEVLTKCNIVQ